MTIGSGLTLVLATFALTQGGLLFALAIWAIADDLVAKVRRRKGRAS